jgi:hypothetical protein
VCTERVGNAEPWRDVEPLAEREPMASIDAELNRNDNRLRIASEVIDNYFRGNRQLRRD